MKSEVYLNPQNYFTESSCDSASGDDYIIFSNYNENLTNNIPTEKKTGKGIRLIYEPAGKTSSNKDRLDNVTSVYLSGLIRSLNPETISHDRFNAPDFRRLLQHLGNEKFNPFAWNLSPQKSNSKIEELIESSRYILTLEEGWDDENALAIDKPIWETATNFLRLYGNYFTEIFLSQIEIPEINPARNNSIDLEWRTEKGRLLINFNNSSDQASYYGDRYANVDNIKGSVDVNEVKEYLAVWMKNCL